MSAAHDLLLQAAGAIAATAGPLLALLVVAGVVVGLFQSTFQLQDAAIAFVPKLVVLLVALVVFGGSVIERLSSLMRAAFVALGQPP